MKRIFLSLAFAVALCSCARNPQPEIIPMPSKVRMGSGHYELASAYTVACQDSSLLALEDFINMNLHLPDRLICWSELMRTSHSQ